MAPFFHSAAHMPITPAHAAAGWPLHRLFRRLPPAALVIGTMAPDFEYILRLRPAGKFGHSPLGLILFCLPVTLAAFWLWRTLLRPALAPLLPPGVCTAVEAPPQGRRTDVYPLAAAAALLGAATHIFWDGFTHGNGWGVALFPALNGLVSLEWGLLWFGVAQYVSSAVGLVIALAWALAEVRRVPREGRRFAPGQRARLAKVVAFLLAVATLAAWANSRLETQWLARLGRAAIGFEAGLIVALVLYALWASRRGTEVTES